jgi:hypothetical protein
MRRSATRVCRLVHCRYCRLQRRRQQAGTRRTGFPPWTVAVHAVSWRTRHALLRLRVAAPRPLQTDLATSRQKPSKFFWLIGMDEDFGQH